MNNGHEICDEACIVIFGASGDLTQRKLIPALYNLYLKRRLAQTFRIVGVARSELTDEQFREKVREGVKLFSPETYTDAHWNLFAPHILYCAGDANQIDSYLKLDEFLKRFEADAANRLYYLSTAPSLYEPTLLNLHAAGMAQSDTGWRRVVVEKPFGYDLASARALNQIVHSVFHERQVYRIDHYLGKETAQNILYLRFANTIFEPIWNRTYIDNVQITVTETVDVGRRADYYDQAGVLRDMFQNHLMQLLALTAMEPPISLDANALRDEKAKVMRAVRPVQPRDTVRAQYRGYRDLPGVRPGSHTPTYAALKLFIDNWRWQGVPFYLRSGKALKRKATEIIIQFRRPPLPLFNIQRRDEYAPNTLSICIQPDEGIHLKFEAKLPDMREGRAVDMEFHYDTSFGKNQIPEAYERLLLDALLGDAGLFGREDEIEASWRIIDGIIDGWNGSHALPLVIYDVGTWGPVETDDLLDVYGQKWQLGCTHD
jgi:glucose-6-phosphate 1-dehydrogenase